MQGKIYLTSGLIIGLILGYWLGDLWRDVSDKPTAPKTTELTNANHHDVIAEDSGAVQNAAQTAGAESKELAKLRLEIAELKAKLQKASVTDAPQSARLIATTNAGTSQPPEPSASDTLPPVKTMTMDEVQRQFMEDIRTSLKQVVIKLNEKEAVAYERGFARNNATSEWGQAYETRISDYLTKADPNGLHFVNQLQCATRLCRLSVTTSDKSAWQKVVSGMIHSDWYNSLSFVTSREGSPELIYYFERSDR